MQLKPHVARLPERAVAVVPHLGSPETVDVTRRPLYQHMILRELIGGPSMLRWLDPPQGEHVVDALVQTFVGFEGDEVCRVELLAGGPHVVAYYQGPPGRVANARTELAAWIAAERLRASGPMLQVHLMDPVDGELEAELQVPLQEHP